MPLPLGLRWKHRLPCQHSPKASYLKGHHQVFAQTRQEETQGTAGLNWPKPVLSSWASNSLRSPIKTQGSIPSHAARQLLGGWYLPGGYCLFKVPLQPLSEKTEEHKESGGADKLQGAGNMKSCEVLKKFWSLSVSFSSKLAEPRWTEEQSHDTARHKASAAPQDPLPKEEKHTPPSPPQSHPQIPWGLHQGAAKQFPNYKLAEAARPSVCTPWLLVKTNMEEQQRQQSQLCSYL